MVQKKRLVDADAICQECIDDFILETCEGCVIETHKLHKTIDPESLRPQGKWVEWYPPKHMIMTGEELLYRCSACDAKYADVEGYRYCPHCGAQMGGTEDG